MVWRLHEYASHKNLLEDLTRQVSEQLIQTIYASGTVSIALSGGSTPRQLYQRLSMCELPWGRVKISLVDERWVDEQHADSNARLVRETLLLNKAAAGRFQGMKSATADAFLAQDAVSDLLLRTVMPLDLVILGMGEDGHTASFFPGAAGLDEALRRDSRRVCCALLPQGASYARMSLTLVTLLSATHRLLYITGKAKRAVLERALEPGDVHELPVRALLHDKHKLTEIYYAPDN